MSVSIYPATWDDFSEDFNLQHQRYEVVKSRIKMPSKITIFFAVFLKRLPSDDVGQVDISENKKFNTALKCAKLRPSNNNLLYDNLCSSYKFV